MTETTNNELELRFSSEQLDDLYTSGLSNETILEAGIKSVCPGDINKIFGYETHARSCCEIPYPETEHSRYKMFYDDADKINPKTGEPRPKYLAKKDSGNHLYIPGKVRPILQDISVPLYITEGEKKSLKACQEGLYCIAIAGLWNWKVKDSDELIPDFDLVALHGREIHIVPDNDWLNLDKHGRDKNLKQAVYRLGEKLQERGAKVFIVLLPEESEAGK